MCDRNCFACPYPDCIIDGLSDEEIIASEQRDREVKAERSKPTTAYSKERAVRWRKEHPERYRQIQKAYRDRNRDVLRAKARANYKKKKSDR